MGFPFAFWKGVGGPSEVGPLIIVEEVFFPGHSFSESFSVKNSNGAAMTITWDADPNPYFTTPSPTVLAAGQTKIVGITRTSLTPNVGTLAGTWICGAASGSILTITLNAS
jgi:hypothetical protein